MTAGGCVTRDRRAGIGRSANDASREVYESQVAQVTTGSNFEPK